jgi:hypothetical protein
MRRGILVLTEGELQELVKYVPYRKFSLAMENLKEENRILVTDEEIENILDEIGRPNDNEIINGIIMKLSNLLRSLGNR